jgi:hypothetical protein
MKKLIFRLLCATGLLVLCVPQGCVEYSSFCSNAVDCVGGNDKDKSACADGLEGEEDAAKDYGCSTQFDAWQTCLETNSVCVQRSYTTQACNAQNDAVEACIKANSALRK